jgi:serine/threonine-protein kinase
VRRITEDAVPAPGSRIPDLAPALDAVVLKALSREAGDRFSTALEMAEALAGATKLPTRTEVAAWVKRHARPKSHAPKPVAHDDGTTTIVAVLERSGGRRATAIDRLPRRGLAKLAIAAAGVAIMSIAGVAVANVAKSTPVTVAAARVEVPQAAAPVATVATTMEAPKAAPAAPTPPSARAAPIAKRTPAPTATAAPESTSRREDGSTCRPPYVVDALGHRHYRVECL